MEITPEQFWAFLQVLWIDVALAGDNAVVVGMAAAGVAKDKRRMVIFWGIAAAVVLRIIFALMTTWLLSIIGLLLAGGILLLWVSWKLWREIRERSLEDTGERVLEGEDVAGHNGNGAAAVPVKSTSAAIRQIVIADVSMSLDNVLAVAGAAKEHPEILIFGLALSVVLMGAAATLVARLLTKYHWIAYLGLAVILYVAVGMVWEGGEQVLHAMNEAPVTAPSDTGTP